MKSTHPTSVTREYTSQIQTWFTISVNTLPKALSFSGVIDSTHISPAVPDLQAPATFTGSISNHQLQLTATPQGSETPCTSKLEAAFGEIRPLINNVPLDLTTGATWMDSVTINTCAGDRVPGVAYITRQYSLQAPKEMNGRQILEIRRLDKVQLSGDGSQGQHQIHVDAEGTGNTLILIDATTGVIAALEGEEQLRIAVKASGRTQNFIQSTKQTIQQIR